MINSEKKVIIVKPSKKMFQKVNDYKNTLSRILPKAIITLIGSLAVPMCGRKEIDLLIETSNVKKAQQVVHKKNFSIGPIINGEGFCRTKSEGVICELHIVPKNHKKIKEYLSLIQKLKQNPKILKKYETLKKSLNGSPINIYKQAKNKFLKDNNLI